MIEILAPGLLTTLQGLGRDGYAKWGISAGGAADPLALRVGNRLVGNADHAAALEMTLLGATIRFHAHATAALAGADFGATLDGAPVALWRAFEVQPGQVLACGVTRGDARGYVCVRGGLQGSALRKGDVVEFAPHAPGVPRGRARPSWLERFAPRRVLRVTAGPEAEDFAHSARETFYSASFSVREESDRAGLRLDGPSIEPPFAGNMITEGVSLGAVQVPPGGQPIILFVDQQTTGGYPIVANVIAADLASVGQLRPRDQIRFELVSMDHARRLLLELEASLETEAFEP
jgi:allophanate hydrolase subunit 2